MTALEVTVCLVASRCRLPIVSLSDEPTAISLLRSIGLSASSCNERILSLRDDATVISSRSGASEEVFCSAAILSLTEDVTVTPWLVRLPLLTSASNAFIRFARPEDNDKVRRSNS